MLLFPLTNCMSLTILYEKKVEKTVEQTYRIYLEQLIKSINTITAKKNINFDIDKIQSYSTYVNQEEYADLSGYAGEGNIKKRMEILEKMKVENYIFAVTTNLYDEMEEYQIVTPCKINYIFNLDSQENYDNDLLSNLQYALREALSHVIKYDGIIPNLLNTQDKLAHEGLEKHVDKLDTDRLFASCNKNESMKQDDEDVSLDRLEALLSKLQNKPEKREQKNNDNKEKKDEVKGESGLIIKSLQQLQKKIEQVDARIREVETGTTDMKPKNKRSRLRHAGMYESENVTPITLTNHDTTNYHPFNFKKKDLKKQESNDTTKQ